MILRLGFTIYALVVAVLLIRAGMRTPPYNFHFPDLLKTERPRALPLFELRPAGTVSEAPARGYREDAARTGTVTEVWPAAGDLKLKFERPALNLGLHSASKASPVVDESGGYVGGDSSWFFAFDHDGQTRWKFRVKDSEWGIHATAAVDGSQVYVGAYNGRLYALDRATGRTNWVRLLGDALGASPLVTENEIYAAVETTRQTNGFVAKLTKRTGEILWVSPFLGEHAHSSPTYSREFGRVVVGANNSFLFGLDDRNGDIAWKVAFPGPIKSTPALLGPYAYVTSWAGGVKAVDIRDGQVMWSADLGADSQVSATVIENLKLVIVGDERGRWSAFDTKTGAARWSRQWVPRVKNQWMKGSATAQMFQTLHGMEWRLWVPCGFKALCLVRAANGELLRQWSLPATLSGAPVVHDQELWLALEGPLQVWEWRKH